MGITSLPDLVKALRQPGLLEAEQLAALDKPPLKALDAKSLGRELVRRGWLTPFQINQVVTGKGQHLFLGEYILLDILGKGGMGQVFKARQRRLKRLAAVKIIRKECLANPDAVTRFLREAEAAARLSHQNIVAIYDASEVHGVHFIAMEYIEGTNLADAVKDCPLPIPTACDYVRQAALGLQHAHEQGMIHRDLKPENLMLTKQGVVKILDLGLARLTEQANSATRTAAASTMAGSVLGTPDYIAPEQALNARKIDIRADIYSLGCTLYHLLAGKPPFRGESLTETLLKHHLEEPPAVEELRRDLPEGLPELVRRLMAKKPEDRYQTPAELADALTPYCQGGGATNIVRARRASGGRPKLLVPFLVGGAALAGLFFLLIGGIVIFYLTRSPASAKVGDTDKTRPAPSDKDRVSTDGPSKDRRDKSPRDKAPPDKDPPPKEPARAPDTSKLKLVFQDHFNVPSGFPVQKADAYQTGYAGGRYFIRVNRGMSGWHNGKQYPGNFVCQLIGRVTGAANGAWGLTFVDKEKRGICFAVSGRGLFQVMPSPFGTAPGPQIAPFQHRSLKMGEEFNELITVVKGRRVEAYLNSIEACPPIVLDREVASPFTVLMGFTDNQQAQAEFESITIWALDGT